MKRRWFFTSAAILSLSGSGLAWHTPDSVKTTAHFLPGSVAGSAKRGTGSGSTSSSQPTSSTSQVTYGVEYVPGGIDRVILFKRDAARNLCIQVMLASPAVAELEMPAGKLDLPPDWTVERAILLRDADACGLPLRRRPVAAVDAAAISGSVRWGGAPTEKTTVDLTLSFPARGSEPPSTEKLAFKRLK